MKIKVYADLRKAVLFSSITKKEFDLVSKAAPESLNLTTTRNGEETVDFVVCYGDHGSISKFGVIFDRTAMDGSLIVEIPVTSSAVDDMKAEVAEKLLPVQLKLQKIETAVAEQVAAISVAQAELVSTITVD